ncbi:MAG TPA: TAT-variant-translocated molybdopterin oxidoreductase [Vicinamibacterales bacterium]|nr:TAT-variant-translocated molybdopterin oxidoreductase [Vicinamibacterales bacterium]
MGIEGNASGKRFWRTLDERADDPAFLEFVHNEFPSQIEAVTDPVARRTFLKLMGASLALAGFTACTRQPPEKIVPYVRQPEELIPGRPLFFATVMPIGGVATGLVVESHEGRPTKVEGNALHPGSLGAADVLAQAAVLGLYDPDRSQTLTDTGDIRPWSAFLGAMHAALTAQQALKGAGLRILTESIGSPTLGAQLRDLLTRYPAAKWHQWDPASRDNVRVGAKLAFGEFVDTQYRLEQADVIVALDSDFLSCGPASLRLAREFASRRRLDQADRMNRFYAIESLPTSTGSRADHRLPLRASDVETAARQLAAAVGVAGVEAPAGALTGTTAERARKFIAAVATDLKAHRGASLVIAGEQQPPAVHALAHALNQALGNAGKTVVYTQPVEVEPVAQLDSLRDLVADLNAGKVDLLVMLSGNPVYTAPPDLKFADALMKAQLRVHLSLYDDETSALCQWHIPEAHFLESWSDARAFDGTASIVQPLIAPLYDGKTPHEVLAALTERPERRPYDIVREYWSKGAPTPEFEANWRRWLHDGVIAGTAYDPRSVTARPPAARAAAASSGLEIAFRNDPSIVDGRFANNGWLQELPKPVTKITWDNAVLMSPATASRLNVGGSPAAEGGEHGQITSDLVEIRCNGRSVRGAAFVVVGHPDDAVTVHLGYGRTRAGQLGNGAGFDANQLRTSETLAFAGGAEIVRTGETYPLACTQYHHLMEGRNQIRALTRDEFIRDPKAVHEGDETPPRTITLYPDYKYEGHKWGMAIDVNSCIGCNACVVGCQAENNIPVVGKAEVLRGHEMHWIRVDTYYRGPMENPETYFQPVPCMQCENAPCEVVCPVGATVHSHEGLNDMVYNRCVGTRYCSNNCPYKVRRFNFFLYQDWNTPSLKLGRNPDVTVRSRGVMEKCTYCVQRINERKIDAEREDRPIADGEIKTACQQTCPADAIVFGDLNDPKSRVAQLQAEVRNYSLLGELNTRPRTTYLAAVRNVNPELGD